MAKREELRADCRKSYNDELPALCSPPHTDQVVKSRKKEMGGTSGKTEIPIGFWWGDVKQREHLEDLCLDGRIIK